MCLETYIREINDRTQYTVVVRLQLLFLYRFYSLPLLFIIWESGCIRIIRRHPSAFKINKKNSNPNNVYDENDLWRPISYSRDEVEYLRPFYIWRNPRGFLWSIYPYFVFSLNYAYQIPILYLLKNIQYHLVTSQICRSDRYEKINTNVNDWLNIIWLQSKVLKHLCKYLLITLGVYILFYKYLHAV